MLSINLKILDIILITQLLFSSLACIQTHRNYDIDGNELYIESNNNDVNNLTSSSFDGDADILYIDSNEVNITVNVETKEYVSSSSNPISDENLRISNIKPKDNDANNTPIVLDLPYYIVKPGDTLSEISKLIYGDMRKWTEIAEVNKKKNPDYIVPGEIIYLKIDEHETNRYLAEKVQQDKNVETLTLFVKKGDTLSSIAKDLYGNSDYWRNLAQLNSDKISNPNRIYPGERIQYQKSFDERIVFYKNKPLFRPSITNETKERLAH